MRTQTLAPLILFSFLLACGDDDDPAEPGSMTVDTNTNDNMSSNGNSNDNSNANSNDNTNTNSNQEPAGPFAGVEIETDVSDDGLSGTVDVARDEFGILHITADSLADAIFAQGYLTAHDRLGQMELLRRNAEGSIAEIFGALNPSTIDSDLFFRSQRLRFFAEQSLAELQASSDPADAELLTLLDRYADGVNAFVEALVTGEEAPLDAAIIYVDPTAFREWTPVDTVMIGRLLAFQLSFSLNSETNLSIAADTLNQVYNSSSPRPGFALDVLNPIPAEAVATTDGFPNVDVDTGTRSNAGAPAASSLVAQVQAQLTANAPAALQTNDAERSARLAGLKAVRDLLARVSPYGVGAPLDNERGSNTWAVGEALAGDGKAILASDQHLDLSNPSIFYPVHVLAGDVDISGVTFPGAPGIVLGRNPTLAWGSTVVAHDALDVYSETRVDCPESDAGSLGCVTFNGESVALEFVTETIFVGEAGTPTRAPIVVQYPIVPHHGPLIPDVRGGEIVGFQDLSVRYTGYQASQELRALSKLWTAETIDEGFTALGDFVFGGQNWVFADTSGNIGWTTHAEIPVRAPLAYTFNPQTGQGAAPFLVLPGDGSAGNFEWVGAMSARYIPHVINPASGYIATANQDPVGETFDGNALDGPVVDSDDNPDTADTPLYLGHGYAAGYRNARIVELIEEAASAGEVTADQMAAAQLDTLSVTGRVFQPFLVTALSFVEDTTGAPMDVVTLVGGLEEGESDSLVDARDRIEAWTLATPAAFEVLGSGETTALSPEMIADSVATSIFNAWLVAFLDGVLGDEFSGAGLSRGIISSRTQMSILERAVFAPDTLANGVLIATGQATICDNLNELGDQSCTAVALEAMLRALGVLEDPQTGFGTNARDMWRWGDIHRVDLDSLAPSARLTLPAPTDPDPATRGIGFPRSGDNFNINRTDPGIGDFNFEHTNSGPAQRFVAELSSAGIRVRLQIPGGTVFNRQSPFYRNLMDDYWQPGEYFDVPHTLAEIQESAVERHLFR